jgi:hypothetical protein
MKVKYCITLYHLGRKSDKIMCTRSYKSTLKYALLKHLFKGHCLYFNIKKVTK